MGATPADTEREINRLRGDMTAALGEVEFVTGLAAMSASGNYGPCRVAEGIVSGGDLTVGARVRELLEAETTAAAARTETTGGQACALA